MCKPANVIAVLSIFFVSDLFACERQPSAAAQCVVAVDLKVGKAVAVFPVLREQKSWKWRKASTRDSYAEYIWNINLGRCGASGTFEESEFGFGTSLYKYPGNSEQAGTLSELLRYTQTNVWRKERTGSQIAFDNLSQFHAFSAVDGGDILITLKDSKAVDLLFKARPPAAFMEAILAESNQSYSCIAKIEYR